MGDIYIKKKYMNFLAILGSPQSQQQFVISANSWSSCLAYCEGTGQQIMSITQISNANVVPNVSGITSCYQVAATNSSGTLINNYVWETNFDTLTTWIDSQSFQSVNSMQFSNKTYVVV